MDSKLRDLRFSWRQGLKKYLEDGGTTSSKTFVITLYTTRCHIAEDLILDFEICEKIGGIQ
jgi:hypothetical protein